MKKRLETQRLVRSNVLNMRAYSSARNEFKSAGDDFIFMDANENPFENGLNRYPDPNQSQLKKTLASLKGVSPSQILLGNGSDEVLDLLFRAYCEPKLDAVITLPPTYGMYKVLANLNAVKILQAPLNENFEIDIASVLKAVTEHTKIIFLCSPNNPTGNVIEANKIKFLLSNFNGLVVIDEAYIDFCETESWITYLNDFSNLVVTQTFSKAFGMAGIRLGVCYAGTAIISVLHKIKPPYNVNALTQQAALNLLDKMPKVEKEIDKIKRNRGMLSDNLERLTFVKKVFPSQANFLLIEVDDAQKRYHQLIEKGIVIRNRTNEYGCKNMLRITVGTEKENKELIKTMRLLQN
ncbi:histidinol-phosphate transaminase [Rasiella rasia]|uniref:Histidinol-phosphate aminotransferase n=1 Tax=Rasiella rasia TaxID=2744027 RepID=A0A6G6GIR3_9FLAO|nr:histidinol-phosphate transaminase [Rasiella rasia]QIE58465.1 histidinol-phosphate transaminase [Rasiella rasia]